MPPTPRGPAMRRRLLGWRVPRWMARGGHGLRVEVRFHGVPVSQAVHWPSRACVAVGASLDDAIPTPDGGPLAMARWHGRDEVALRPCLQGLKPRVLRPGEAWHWTDGRGVEVQMDLVPRIPARRRPNHMGGDVALLTLMLMLTVGAAQVQTVARSIFPDVGIQAHSVGLPSPELIARLMRQDLDGAAGDRPLGQPDPEVAPLFMPAGQDGDFSRAGGGREIGPDVSRVPQPLAEEEPAEELRVEVSFTPEAVVVRAALPEAMERFVGWGFSDWLDVEGADVQVVEAMADALRGARRKLAIDPDDPAAIQILGHYAYLSERHGLSQESFGRYIELFPEDPAGYNNLALTFKRSGELGREEALYRQALLISPLDEHVLNNLAVNLARQGRTDEALGLMGLLGEISPGDPYAELHRAKIHASMGQHRRAYRHLRAALEGSTGLTTLHQIEFRQDLRLDPSLDALRGERRFARILRNFYREDAAPILARAPTKGGRHG